MASPRVQREVSSALARARCSERFLNHRGPSVILHGEDLSQPLEEEVRQAAERLRLLKDGQRASEEAFPREAEPQVARVHRLLALETDPRYVQICSFLAECDAPQPAQGGAAGSSRDGRAAAGAALAERRAEEGLRRLLAGPLRSALADLRRARNPDSAEHQLREMHGWLSSQWPPAAAGPPPGPPGPPSFWSEDTAADPTMPGSALRGCGGAEGEPIGAAPTRHEVSLSEAALIERGLLPETGERLQGFMRHQVIPDFARRGPAAPPGGRGPAGGAPPAEGGKRPPRPLSAASTSATAGRPLSAVSTSANTCGYPTARSCASGRSTALGVHSRPASAGGRPASAGSLRHARPATAGSSGGGSARGGGGGAAGPQSRGASPPAAPAASLPAQRPPGEGPAAATGEAPGAARGRGAQAAAAARRTATPGAVRAAAAAARQNAPVTQEELNMESRWLAARNREVSEQLQGLQQRAVVQQWAERRARMEEQISRNAEAVRFQSDLRARAYHPPPDAGTDIEPTAHPLEECAGQLEALAQAPEPAADAAQGGFDGAARQQGSRPPSRPLSARIELLRKVHARVLQGGAGPQPQADAASPAADACAGPPPDAAAAAALALQRPDASDPLVGLCELWCQKHGLDERQPGFQERRARQLQEAEEVRRKFELLGFPVDPDGWERGLAPLQLGLVMPEPAPQAAGDDPRFRSDLLSNPFLKHAPRAKKPRRRRRRTPSAKGGGRTGRPAAPRPTSTARSISAARQTAGARPTAAPRPTSAPRPASATLAASAKPQRPASARPGPPRPARG